MPYTVTDEEGGPVTVTERVGSLVKRTYQAVLGQTNEFQLTGIYFMQILNGPQAVTIEATDEGGLTASLELPFTKAVYAASVSLAQPLEVEDAITVAIMSVLGSVPSDADYEILATNNANDAVPVWQDVTADVKAGRNIIFTNKAQANGPAFNFKVSAKRAPGGQGGYFSILRGGFQ